MNKNICQFDSNEYQYGFGDALQKTHKQSRCPVCGLWTVYTNKKTGLYFSLCVGRNAITYALAVDKVLEQDSKAIITPARRRMSTS